MMASLDLVRKFVGWIDGGIYLSGEYFLRALKGIDDFAKVHLSHDHHINVTVPAMLSARERAE